MAKLSPGWYVLLYHDVSWEENDFIRPYSVVCPPDVFRRPGTRVVPAGTLGVD